MLAGWLCWSLLVARIAWKFGFAMGVRHWETKAERAYRLGIIDGWREERIEGSRE